jgi:N-acetylglucosaminyldiphosphoundecaprenol N-acetyl-beta-D-mannosaminyltransferase
MIVPTLSILGTRISIISRRNIFKLCEQWLDEDGGHHVVTVNPEFVMEARTNSAFRSVLNHAHLALADGFGLVLAGLVMHRVRLYRLTGVEFVDNLSRLCANKHKTLYLVGGLPGVVERAARELQQRNQLLRIVGADEGIPERIIMTQEELKSTNEALLQRIHDAKPDVLCVAFGAPKQDTWIAENFARLPSVKIAVGVGGTLNYLAGITPYAPAWVRSLGLEWLYRLVTQPQRTKRIFTAVILFPIAVVREMLFARK